MAINKIEYGQIMQKRLDQNAVIKSVSGWMDANAGEVIYTGGNEIKIPTMSTSGLADYDRDKGYVQGGITVSYETYKMTQDRGRTFNIDAMDEDESNFVATATNAIKVFQDEHVIPEIDSYRYSAIAAAAEKAGQKEAVAITSANVLRKLLEHIRTVQDVIGYEKELIITISGAAWGLLNEDDKMSKFIMPQDFKKGEINTRIYTIDNNKIIACPQTRFMTKYKQNDGVTTGQEAGGLVAADDAKKIQWIITPKTVPLAVSKTDKMRIFTPDENQQANAYKVDYRIYHDLWVKKNDAKSIFLCTEA